MFEGLFAKMIASIIERSCKNYKTTIMGIVAALASALAVYAKAVHPTYAEPLIAIGAFLGLLAGALGYDSKKMAILFLALFLPLAVSAQQKPVVQATTPVSSSNGFSGASDAVAIFYGGEWSAGTHVVESYDFLDFGRSKSNHLYLEGHQLLAPGPGFSVYAGGVKFEPDLTPFLQKTNVPASNFGVTFSAAVGNGIPSMGGSHVSFLAGGGVKYNLTQSLSWQTLQAQYGQFGSNRFAVISTGLAFVFGK
jgi:hypothetical protein